MKFLSINMSLDMLKNQLVSFGIKTVLIRITAGVLALLTSIVLTRALGAQNYGIYVYAMAIVSLLVLLGQLGVPGLIIRSARTSQLDSEWSYLRSMLMQFARILVATTLLISLISLFVLWLLADQLSTHQTYTFIWLLLLLPFLALRHTVTATLHGLNHVVASQIVGGLIPSALWLITLAFVFGFIPATKLPEYAAFINLCVGIVTLTFASLFLWRQLPEEFWHGERVYKTKQWLLATFPFILLAGAGYINANVDIFMLGLFDRVDEVGVYRIAFQVSMVAMACLGVIRVVVDPQIVKMYVEKNTVKLQHMMTTSARIAFIFALPVVLVTFAFGDKILAWLFGSEFAAGYPALIILNFGALAATATGPIVVLAKMTHQEKYAVYTLVLSIMFNVILNIALIPIYGIIGAAIATMISMILRNVCLYYMIRHRINIKSSIF